jgi:hypothetical protein
MVGRKLRREDSVMAMVAVICLGVVREQETVDGMRTDLEGNKVGSHLVCTHLLKPEGIRT